MKYLIAVTLLLGLNAWAEDVELTEACKSKLEKEILIREGEWLKKIGESWASRPSAAAYANYWPDRPTVQVVVILSEPQEGRSVVYATRVGKEEARQCRNLKLERRDQSACRFSTDEGPEGLGDIKGATYRGGPRITPETTISELEEQQIREFLGEDKQDTSVGDLIRDTDDQYLTTATVLLPNGRKLDYFGAYGGDNPYGRFFESGTVKSAGTNSDGSVCIGY